ncbi:MAG TPA: Mut7-C RNAse domain-containing protein [Syntrophorhabdaceae bacterium]|nr:Mut7-C RNAse domain-containing protein [Syntrophorhabdaceae bacterium]
MRFICDITLGRLAKRLRMLGFDTISFTKAEDTLEPYRKLADPPLLLTKRTKPIAYQPVVFVRSNDTEAQLKEIGHLIRPVLDRARFMTRCLACNTLLQAASKEAIEGLIPEYTYHHHSRFKTCPHCKKVYWEGTHTEAMRSITEVFLADTGDEQGKKR